VFGIGSNPLVSHQISGDQDILIQKFDGEDKGRLVWSRNIYSLTTGVEIVIDNFGGAQVTNNGHFIYVLMHSDSTISTLKHLRFVKMSTIDGSIILAKGSYESFNSAEYISRNFDMQISLDDNFLYMNYITELSSTISTGALLKLDYNMDHVYNIHLEETTSGNHDFTTLAISS
jgi:hypothetical protein